MNFYDNYVRLCNQAGKSPSAVATEIGLQKSTVTRWKKGRDATDATTRKVADYFGVSVEALLGEVKSEGGREMNKSDYERLVTLCAIAVAASTAGVLMAIAAMFMAL